VCPIAERKSSVTSNCSSAESESAAITAVERYRGPITSESDDDDDDDEDAIRLKKANERWRAVYADAAKDTNSCCDRRVCFSSSDAWSVITEDPELSAELREARRSDFLRRQLDRERLARIISPVIAAHHRKEVYERMQK
jgi:hypothetical protein